MIQVALATASGTRICARCEHRIIDRTVLLTGGYDDKEVTTSFNLAFHPRCAGVLKRDIERITGHDPV